jgi:universal stress protein A
MLPRTILVPIDFSTNAGRALDYACELATKLGATVHLVHALGAALPELNVALSEQMLRSLSDGSKLALDQLAAEKRTRANIGEARVVPGDARDAILQTARDLGADLVVMGTHGRRGLSRMVLGSVAEHVVRRSPCPVLTIRESAEDVAS